MRLLLDAHTLVWAVDSPDQLGEQLAAPIRDPDNELLLSAGTVWLFPEDVASHAVRSFDAHEVRLAGERRSAGLLASMAGRRSRRNVRG